MYNDKVRYYIQKYEDEIDLYVMTPSIIASLAGEEPGRCPACRFPGCCVVYNCRHSQNVDDSDNDSIGLVIPKKDKRKHIVNIANLIMLCELFIPLNEIIPLIKTEMWSCLTCSYMLSISGCVGKSRPSRT